MLILSFTGIVWMVNNGSIAMVENGPLVIFLFVVLFVSIIAAITFSRTGWRVRGSDTEWKVASAMNPWIWVGRRSKDDLSRDDKKR